MRKIAFLLLPEFSHLGLSAATEPLFVANWLAQGRRYERTLLSADGAPVRASNGMVVPVDRAIGAGGSFDSVFVLASFDPDSVVRDPKVVRWLRRLASGRVEICGIENGSLLLAAAGLLDGRPVAVHWDNVLGFQERYPRTHAVAQLYRRDGHRVTCAGAAAILDMMIAWMEWHGEAGLAAEVAEHLLLGPTRPGGTEQRSAPAAAQVLSPQLRAAQAAMREHIDEPVSCREIARRVGCSIRQLERLFRSELRSSMIASYRDLRLAKAHQLLQQTTRTVTEVSIACGFSSPEYFSRLYRREFGLPPSRDRRQSTSAPVLRQRLPARSAARRLASSN